MKIAGNILVVLLMMLTIQSCQTHTIDRKDGVANVSNGKELILKGRISLPFPERYEKVLLDGYSTIITAPKYSIVYRWINKEEVEFIGSNKSPYAFFKSVFTDPTSEVEERFLEGLKNEVHQSNSSNDLEFYYFDNDSGQQMYILSRSLSFVAEVTYKGEGDKYINSVIAHSKLQ